MSEPLKSPDSKKEDDTVTVSAEQKVPTQEESHHSLQGSTTLLELPEPLKSSEPKKDDGTDSADPKGPAGENTATQEKKKSSEPKKDDDTDNADPKDPAGEKAAAQDEKSPAVTSEAWVKDYSKKLGAPPPLATASVFSNDDSKANPPIPSIDAALRLSGLTSQLLPNNGTPLVPAMPSDWFQQMLATSGSLGGVTPSSDLVMEEYNKLREQLPSLALQQAILRSQALGSGVVPAGAASSSKKESQSALDVLSDAVQTVSPVETMPETEKGPEERIYIDKIMTWDVLCGRGGRSNHHPGNKRYRQVVAEMRERYRMTSLKHSKTGLSRSIVDYVCGYGGRFIKMDAKKKKYFLLTKSDARKKTSQALRETKETKWTLDKRPPTGV